MNLVQSKRQSFYLIKEQKEAIGLLSIGTFLEYFDLMLYVHMAVLLNELFFPATDPFTKKLITAFGFCSTYLLRPFGALIFGYIGDHIGRKSVVIMTTSLMASASLIIGCAPTYAQIGIAASWMITIARIVQGIAATAEVRGAEIYLTEISKPPVQYPLVTLVTVCQAFGTAAAIGVASIFTHNNLNILQSNFVVTDSTFTIIPGFSWRTVFFVGAGVALIGTIARTSLKEAEEFVHKRNKLKSRLKDNKVAWSDLNEEFFQQKSSYKISLAYFVIQCSRPPCFYFIYIYCSDVLRDHFGYTPNEIISQNFWVAVLDLIGILGLTYLSYLYHPYKILKWKLYLFFAGMIFFPIALGYTHNPVYIAVFQCIAVLFVVDHVPATALFYKHFPVFRRFTYTSFLSAAAKLLMYFVSSFGLVYLTEYLKNQGYIEYWAIFIILIPVGIGFYLSVNFFQKLEDQKI